MDDDALLLEDSPYLFREVWGWACVKKVDKDQESPIKENIQMSKKPRRTFTDEQKSAAVKIVEESGKPISQMAREMGLTESALRKWVKQDKIDSQEGGQSQGTSAEKQELINLRRELKRVEMERDFLKKVATFIAKESSTPMS